MPVSNSTFIHIFFHSVVHLGNSSPQKQKKINSAQLRNVLNQSLVSFHTAEFLHLIFPDLAAKSAYTMFYSYVGQHTSVGNYWNDPHRQDLYFEFSSFLPYINNELRCANSTQFRENLLKLEQMVLVGGPNDGVITPWESR